MCSTIDVTIDETIDVHRPVCLFMPWPIAGIHLPTHKGEAQLI